MAGSLATQPQGRVEVICGCMFAGKTALLIERLRAADAAGLRTCAIKHASDRRYDSHLLSTHDGRTLSATSCADAAQLLAAAAAADVVGIDEAQFFGDALVEIAAELRARGLRVVLAGIDHNAWGLPFEPMPRLKSLADSVSILTMPCEVCGAAAHFTQRMTPISNGDMVGGPEDYAPRCRNCFRPVSQFLPPR